MIATVIGDDNPASIESTILTMAKLIQSQNPSDFPSKKTEQQIIASSKVVQDTVARYRSMPGKTRQAKAEKRALLSMLVGQFTRAELNEFVFKRDSTQMLVAEEGEQSAAHKSVIGDQEYEEFEDSQDSDYDPEQEQEDHILNTTPSTDSYGVMDEISKDIYRAARHHLHLFGAGTSCERQPEVRHSSKINQTSIYFAIRCFHRNMQPHAYGVRQIYLSSDYPYTIPLMTRNATPKQMKKFYFEQLKKEQRERKNKNAKTSGRARKEETSTSISDRNSNSTILNTLTSMPGSTFHMNIEGGLREIFIPFSDQNFMDIEIEVDSGDTLQDDQPIIEEDNNYFLRGIGKKCNDNGHCLWFAAFVGKYKREPTIQEYELFVSKVKDLACIFFCRPYYTFRGDVDTSSTYRCITWMSVGMSRRFAK